MVLVLFPFFSLDLSALVFFWYKGCFRHLHTDNQERHLCDWNRLNMGVGERYVKSQLEDG